MHWIEALGAAIPPGSSDSGILTTGDAIMNADPSHADIGFPSAISDGTAGLGDDPYDCGWDDPMNDEMVPSLEPVGDPMITDSKVPSDIYDCGWDDGNAVLVMPCTAEPMDDPYDCGWDNPMDAETVLPRAFPDCRMNNQMDDSATIAKSNLTSTSKQTSKLLSNLFSCLLMLLQ
jgi:hypothetical protein